MPSKPKHSYEFTLRTTRSDVLVILRTLSRALVKQSQQYPFCPFVDELREAWRDAQHILDRDHSREP